MKRNWLFIITLSFALSITGCAASNKEANKTGEKASQKKQTKSKDKKNVDKKDNDDETSSEQEVETSTVDTSISSIFSDEELLAYASENINEMYKERMTYICGTHFASTQNYVTNDSGIYYEVDDPQVQSYNDIANVYYQKFSRKYPICYDKPYNSDPLNRVPFIDVDGKLYESGAAICIHGLGSTYTVGEIIRKSNDEFWVSINSYCSLDDSTTQTDITCSFVWEDGTWKYGDFNNPNFYKVD